MKVVVTGASGNLGTALLRAVRRRSWEVTGVSRHRPEPTGPYEGVEWVECDLGAAEARSRLAEALAGADAVVHLAWAINPRRKDPPVRNSNLRGGATVLRAAVDAKVPLVVCASSSAVYSPGERWTRVDENAPREGIPGNDYSLDKAEFERTLDRFEREHPDVGVSRIRPSAVVQAEAGAQMAEWLLPPWLPRRLIGSGAFPAVLWPRLRMQLVHSADVAIALGMIVESGTPGAFNLAADPVLRPADLAAAFGGPHLPVPLPVVAAAARPSWRLGLQPVHPGWLRMADQARLVDTGRARRELGWVPRHDPFASAAELAEAMRAASPERPGRPSREGRSEFAGPSAGYAEQDPRDRSGWWDMGTVAKADAIEHVPLGREQVWDVLADGWSFPSWVVGASHIREVDEGWPEPGTRIHHSVGPWPFHIGDVTEVLKAEPPRLLVLRARLWPLGSALVRLELDDDGDGTEIRIFERATEGAPAMIPGGLQSRLLAPRNRESLRRLAKLVQGRSRHR